MWTRDEAHFKDFPVKLAAEPLFGSHDWLAGQPRAPRQVSSPRTVLGIVPQSNDLRVPELLMLSWFLGFMAVVVSRWVVIGTTKYAAHFAHAEFSETRVRSKLKDESV